MTSIMAILIAIAAAFISLVSAQNYSTSGPLMIDPSQLPPALLQTWCGAQLHSCPEICGVPPSENQCTASTLQYTCTCSDGSKPNISAYINTIPYFVCEQWITNCVDNHPNNLNGITACRSVTCGSKNASANSGSPSASVTASSPSSSASSMSASSSSSQGMAAATQIAQQYGTVLLGGGMLAVFGLGL